MIFIFIYIVCVLVVFIAKWLVLSTYICYSIRPLMTFGLFPVAASNKVAVNIHV